MKLTYRNIEKETEKALLVEFSAISTGSRFDVKPVWIPKSQTEIHNEKTLTIPDWLMARIERENEIAINCAK